MSEWDGAKSFEDILHFVLTCGSQEREMDSSLQTDSAKPMCCRFITMASIVVVHQKSMCGSPMAWTLKKPRGTWRSILVLASEPYVQ
jgi:hypothetical protein